MVPQPAGAIDQARANEEGGGKPELAQDRIRHADVVAQAVVEGERDARAAVLVAAARDVLERHHRECQAHQAQLALERRGARRRRAVVHQDAVVPEAQHARILPPALLLECSRV